VKQHESFSESLEAHERRHLVLARKGWQTSNGHTYTHSHLPGHTITSHPNSKEWTHHVNNPITKQPERHGSGIWPGGHSFTGYINSVHDRNPTAKAPEWRPMPARTSDCPHCAKGIPHTDAEHSKWTRKAASFSKHYESNKDFAMARLGTPKSEGAYATPQGAAVFQPSGASKKKPVARKPAEKGKPAKQSESNERFLHHGHQRMHDLLSSLGYTRQQHSETRNNKDWYEAPASMTRSNYEHAQWGDKATVMSHVARKNVTVIVQSRANLSKRYTGTPESIFARMGG
jgi:hypothetical protein